MVELLLAPLAVIRRKVIILGEEHMEAALAQGRGAVAIAAHAGNWEYTVMGYGLLCRAGVVVGRELDQPWAARLARYLRQRGGNYMVGKQKGMKGVMGHLRANRPVGIVIDQNTTTAGGLLVDFFGHPARTTPVAALLARRGVPVLPTLSRRLADGRHLMVILPPLPRIKTADPQADIRRHLELQSRTIEAWVRTCPEQWLWLHRRWKNQFPEIYEASGQRSVVMSPGISPSWTIVAPQPPRSGGASANGHNLMADVLALAMYLLYISFRALGSNCEPFAQESL